MGCTPRYRKWPKHPPHQHVPSGREVTPQCVAASSTADCAWRTPGPAPFARTHASWPAPDTTIDDHLVSLADKIWKAKRVPDLEELISTACAIERWQAFAELDDILNDRAADADDRLAYQTRRAVHPPSTP